MEPVARQPPQTPGTRCRRPQRTLKQASHILPPPEAEPPCSPVHHLHSHLISLTDLPQMTLSMHDVVHLCIPTSPPGRKCSLWPFPPFILQRLPPSFLLNSCSGNQAPSPLRQPSYLWEYSVLLHGQHVHCNTFSFYLRFGPGSHFPISSSLLCLSQHALRLI